MRGHFAKRSYTDKKTGQKRTVSTWSVWYDERVNGSRRQKIKSGFRTRKEAEAWFNRKAQEIDEGLGVADERKTVESYLAEWLHALHAPGSKVKAGALHAYENHVNVHIIPAFGKIKLSDLRPYHIEAAKNTWASTTRLRVKDKTRVLSSRTVRHIYGTLRAALKRAQRIRLITANPCDMTDAPTSSREEMNSLNAVSSGALIAAFEDSPLGVAVTVALGTGLRRGELLALRWSDVDMTVGTLTVQRALEHANGVTRFKEPKTSRSRRTISLPGFVRESLQRHRMEQAERFLRLGYGRPKPETLIFERGGKPWVPNTFGSMFWKIIREANLPPVRLHDLRHSFATMALEAGVDLKTVSEALGILRSQRLRTFTYTSPSQ